MKLTLDDIVAFGNMGSKKSLNSWAVGTARATSGGFALITLEIFEGDKVASTWI